jgi:molecular chaperone GrpE
MTDNTHSEEETVEGKEVIEKKEVEIAETPEKPAQEEKLSPEAELLETKNRYLRLYAEFENYKKRIQKDKEELLRYGNESLLHDLLPVMDSLQMALQHASDSASEGLIKGVEITFREFQRVVEKFGLIPISAMGKPFDPSVHHAMTQVERADLDDKTVVEEFRKGYMLGDKVLRPSLVAVSKKPADEDVTEIKIKYDSEEEE